MRPTKGAAALGTSPYGCPGAPVVGAGGDAGGADGRQVLLAYGSGPLPVASGMGEAVGNDGIGT
jgi:hypothetical protein